MELAHLLYNAGDTARSVDRACAVLWWTARQHGTSGLAAREIAKLIQNAGYPALNVSRLDDQLGADRRVARVPGARAWRLTPAARSELDERYSDILEAPLVTSVTDSVLPRDLFKNTRGYLERVVHQINASYDHALYDCCAVMCRRLLETLIIETYEQGGRAVHIKGSDGNFFMFADLLRNLLADPTFNLSRNARRGLEDFKKLGDLSAHNRRFNAHKNDIDRVRDGIRVAAQELLHLSALHPQHSP